MKKYILFIVSVLLLFYSCSKQNKPVESKKNVAGNYHYLQDKEQKIFLPIAFRESGRYRLKNDVPIFRNDTFMLSSLQRQLERMEFTDSEIDVFVDTSSNYHLLIIVDMARIPLDQTTGSLVAKNIKQQHDEEEIATAGFIKFKTLETSYKRAVNGEYFKFKYEMTSILEDKIYDTRYVLTTDSQTFFLIEMSDSKPDLENYIAKLH